MDSNKTQPNGHHAYDSYDPRGLPDFDIEFITHNDLHAFEEALDAPESSPVVALNDWRPVQQRVKRKNERSKRRKPRRRRRDETREGYFYALLQWPFFLVCFAWLAGLGIAYLLTRIYVWAYEHILTWRGQRDRLRQVLRSRSTYASWIKAANELDNHLGTDIWKQTDDYAYYQDETVRKVKAKLKYCRECATDQFSRGDDASGRRTLDDLVSLIQECAKGNFAGTENPRVYSETYYGTKTLIQEYVDELKQSLSFVMNHSSIEREEKYMLAKHIHTNLGRTALCLSGGASFAYYHFGVVKALLDNNVLPDIITGTSGGALVAALVATRTNEELEALLVPALAHRITACEESISTWFPRWWKTGARFDTLAWARKCSWFTRGSLTFREAYERTGRILNITCIPSDPHSPTILANYLTAPNCVIWSAVIASAAVPGILNPVVLLLKSSDGRLLPYSFGHKWKDGSLRTDIPIKSLNLHFNVSFSIVSQVNPHVNLFFFSSRGTVGRPVTHRRGRGWRGGFLGSALEQYLKLDLQKWLKVLSHLELIPRWLDQDWTGVWLQTFEGTITIWPRSKLSDFYYILSDPSPQRLARMIQAGQSSTFPKILFITNRMKVERLVEQGLLLGGSGRESMHLRGQARRTTISSIADTYYSIVPEGDNLSDEMPLVETPQSLSNAHGNSTRSSSRRRLSGTMEELRRQSLVFFDDSDVDGEGTGGEETDTSIVEEEPVSGNE